MTEIYITFAQNFFMGTVRYKVTLTHADKMVELKYVDSISHETVRRTLKKTKAVV